MLKILTGLIFFLKKRSAGYFTVLDTLSNCFHCVIQLNQIRFTQFNEIAVQFHREIFNYQFKTTAGLSLANKITIRIWHLLKCHMYFASRINIA